MDDDNLPPPFLIGHKYRDREGEYTVIAANGNQLTIERSNGHRTVADAEVKARIHRNVVTEGGPLLGRDRLFHQRKGPVPSERRTQLMETILLLEADGANHSGVEIDRILVRESIKLGYSDRDVSMLHPQTGRSAFANDGDWAKAKMTEERFHEVVGSMAYKDGESRRTCNVYRITPKGLEQLRRRS